MIKYRNYNKNKNKKHVTPWKIPKVVAPKSVPPKTTPPPEEDYDSVVTSILWCAIESRFTKQNTKIVLYSNDVHPLNAEFLSDENLYISTGEDQQIDKDCIMFPVPQSQFAKFFDSRSLSIKTITNRISSLDTDEFHCMLTKCVKTIVPFCIQHPNASDIVTHGIQLEIACRKVYFK
jgi:hypothetical protein